MTSDEHLTHYASKYYDPVKAHEYYMRTRELKGRRSSSKLTEEGKKVWSYTKKEISDNKKADVDARRSERDATIETLRANAKATRESISSNLERLREALVESTKRKREDVAKNVSAEIEKVLSEEMPKGLSKKQQIKWTEDKNKKVTKLRGEASKDLSEISEDSKSEKASYSADAAKRRAQTSARLKSAIEATRAAYAQAKTSLDESYEDIYQTEYNKILSEYEKPARSKGAKSK